ncbi:hypothetical protein C1645_813107 [Glomus cerebriforme]|uniref:Serine-threonine/tyrosine-protein kinase catalytic domain-containing protein n=1 Tax=Glomus cerebriforme TaxID=658196 RepID=A0A397TTH8_9GLOM|nr:hypothetical protein C1645_813107 [Glomus cerebriforme]
MPHEEFLEIKICQGLRTSFNIKVSQLIVDIFKQCADEVPSKRPTAKYLHEIFRQWKFDLYFNYKKNEIYKIFIQVDLNFNNLPEQKNADDEEKYSNS